MRFGVDAVATLAELVRDVGAERAFVVTDPGVMGSGVAARVVGALEDVGIGTALFDEVEANPGTTTVARDRPPWPHSAGWHGRHPGRWRLVDGQRQGDGAPRRERREVLALGYHRDDVAPGVPVIAIPTTAGTGAETNTYGVITDEAAGRKDYVGHPSVLPRWSLLDPALTVGVPPAATAATGVDALTHSLESCCHGTPTRSPRRSRWGSSGPSASGCPGRSRTARTSRRARSRC